jgi:hypothetical protein
VGEVSLLPILRSGESAPDPDGKLTLIRRNSPHRELDRGEPIAVMRCNRCGSCPNVDEDGVVCPLCRNGSPVRSSDLEKLIEAWNAMVDPGE